MKVLLIGGLGSIGSRYACILRYLKIPYEIHDLRDDQGKLLHEYDFTHSIIATPTNHHIGYVKWMATEKKPFLCEKPVSKRLEEICIYLESPNAYVVNNYAFMFDQFKMDSCKILYNYYRTGSDGLFFDVCQLLFLDYEATILTNSPIWTVENDHAEFTYRNVEESYIDMIRTFLGIHDHYDHKNLWTIREAYEMTRRAIKRST